MAKPPERHSFIAYIDECGDDGLGNYRVPGVSGGASRWLTLSATVCRMSRERDAITWRDEIRSRLDSKSLGKPLHFVGLRHEQRVMAAQLIARKPIRSICVVANKPAIPAGIYTGKNQLYFYLCRYLIERISWLCSDMRPRVPEGDGRVKIVFSRRGGMSYPDFQDYLSKLKGRNDIAIQIRWPVIDIEGVAAQDHSRNAGLQISDIIASGITAGVEPNHYGNCELRYAETLKPIIYRRNGNFLSYGMKFYPWADQLELTAEQVALVELFK